MNVIPMMATPMKNTPMKSNIKARYILLLGLVSGVSLAETSTMQSQPVSVKTLSTTYIGKVSDKQPMVEEYLGIPFAIPPVGERRWRAPAPIIDMPAQYDSQQFKPACYQLDYNTDWYKQVAELFGTKNLAMDMPPVSEDCLYLNIWKPSPQQKIEQTIQPTMQPTMQQKKSLPVMVWIHGGSNKAGWSFEPNYLGQELANTGNVIVVSIAYRLGVFGFFAHPEFDSPVAKTNFGIFDQIAALQWVQKNINFFGGNKNNVTVFGESAGAANIAYLMSTPKAQGLFHQAISQSGGFQMLADSTLEQAQTLGRKLTEHFDIDNKNANQLRQLPADKVWKATKQVAPDHDFRAVQDQQLFKQSLPQAFAKNANVNLLIGSNKNEYYMYISDAIDKPELVFVPTDESASNAMRKHFLSFTEPRLGQDWLDTFLYMACPSALMAQLVTNNDRQAWLYRFERTRENGDMIKAYHGAEIPYVFDTHDAFLPTNDVDQTLTENMMSAWTNFAHFGNPNGSASAFTEGITTMQPTMQLTVQPQINWRPYSQENPALLIFDKTVKHSQFEQQALCQQLWPDYLKR